MNESGTARDGMPARLAGRWTKDKLYYVERYAKAFMGSMAPKREERKWGRLLYLDLLCGPGLCIDRETGEEIQGSPLNALNVTPPFDHLFLSDISPENIDVLKKRIPPQELHRTSCESGDCNQIAAKFIQDIRNNDLGLAFLDPEGFEVKFDTFTHLSRRRLDLIYLFSTGGTIRNIDNWWEIIGNQIDECVGGIDWRDEISKKGSPLHVIVGYFRKKMQSIGYTHFDSFEPPIFNTKNVRMYHLLFFSKDKAGLTIWRNIKKIGPSGQRELPYNP